MYVIRSRQLALFLLNLQKCPQFLDYQQSCKLSALFVFQDNLLKLNLMFSNVERIKACVTNTF